MLISHPSYQTPSFEPTSAPFSHHTVNQAQRFYLHQVDQVSGGAFTCTLLPIPIISFNIRHGIQQQFITFLITPYLFHIAAMTPIHQEQR